MAVAVQWKQPFSGGELKGGQAAGMPPSEVPAKAGRIAMAGQDVGFLVTGRPNEKDLKVYFDLNGDGVYQGAGEGPLTTGDTVLLGDKRQVIILGSGSGPAKPTCG